MRRINDERLDEITNDMHFIAQIDIPIIMDQQSKIDLHDALAELQARRMIDEIIGKPFKSILSNVLFSKV